MTIAVFHGSPRRGNTYMATRIFMDELEKRGGVRFTEFFLPESMPEFCAGCQLCLSGPNDRCPHSRYVTPVLDAIITSDALIFTSPHHGASDMPACMKNLLDHLDFLTMTVAPRAEMFNKKAFIITTGSGSTAAVKPIRKCLRNWGVNRVYSLGLRMFTDKWEKLTEKKRTKFENSLRRAAQKFYSAKKGRPYASTVFMYYMNKFILKKYIGEGAYPYEYWRENGYFNKQPF